MKHYKVIIDKQNLKMHNQNKKYKMGGYCNVHLRN
jgi:hypothetical protein